MADLHVRGRPKSLSLDLQKPVTATAAFLSLSATLGRVNTGAGQGRHKRAVSLSGGIGVDAAVEEHVGIVVRAMGPSPEWAETRREAGLGRAGLLRPAR
jgi:hypothetical protein